MGNLDQAKADLDLVVNRRIQRAPAEVRRRLVRNGPLVSYGWLVDSRLMLLVGNRGDISAAFKRKAAFGDPFPKLFNDERGIFQSAIALPREEGSPISSGSGGNTIASLSFDLSASDFETAVSLGVGRCVLFRSIHVKVDAFASHNYEIPMLCAYRGNDERDTVLFGVDEIEASITREISRLRLVNHAG